jgi:signal transduction histidine kinase
MLAQGRVADNADRQRCYDFLSRESERLDHLVEELLDFGRIEGGAYRYQFEPIDAARLVRDLVRTFQERLPSKGHRVEFADEGRATVMADRAALSRAIWNLLDNAVKYSPGAETIWVTCARERATVVIRVRDAGLGIAASEQKSVFRKFVRGTNARSLQIKGTGIGLAMVQHIMDAHHGVVQVTSRPNQGSTFALLLPMEKSS